MAGHAEPGNDVNEGEHEPGAQQERPTHVVILTPAGKRVRAESVWGTYILRNRADSSPFPLERRRISLCRTYFCAHAKTRTAQRMFGFFWAWERAR